MAEYREPAPTWATLSATSIPDRVGNMDGVKILAAVRQVDELRAELERLRAALQVCEEALHHRSVIRDDADEDMVHAAQQASGAYYTQWQPETGELSSG